MGKKQRYYVVWDGIRPGIYTDWKECERQIKGYAAAKYKSFDTKEEAERAYASPCWDYIGRNAAQKQVAAVPSWRTLPAARQPRCPSIAVDAACSGNPGLMEYRGVDTATGREIFRQGPFVDGTNNIGEFLALVHALALLQQSGHGDLPVYSDSLTAQAWVRKKHAATKLMPTAGNQVLFQLIERAEAWLRTHVYTNPVLKWNTPEWGEVPADFGRK